MKPITKEPHYPLIQINKQEILIAYINVASCIHKTYLHQFQKSQTEEEQEQHRRKKKKEQRKTNQKLSKFNLFPHNLKQMCIKIHCIL